MIIDLFKKITINVMDYNTGKSFNAINSAINSNTSLVITNDVQNCLKIFNSIVKYKIKNNTIKLHDVYIIPYNNHAMNLIKDIQFDKIILDDYYTLSYNNRMKFLNCYFDTFNNISVDIEIYSSGFDFNKYQIARIYNKLNTLQQHFIMSQNNYIIDFSNRKNLTINII